MYRKPFSKLSSRQKRRRIDHVNLNNVECSEENRLLTTQLGTPENNLGLGRAEFVGELGNSLDLQSCSYRDGNVEPTEIDDSSDHNPFSNVIGNGSCNLDSMPTHSLELDADLGNESMTNNMDIKLMKSVVSDELTAVLSSWLESEKKVPHASVDRLLLALRKNNFDVPNSSKTLFSADVTTSIMESGHYFHSPDWMTNMKSYAESASQSGMLNDVNSLHLITNIDGLPLFNPLGISKFTCYPILVKYYEIPQKNFCVEIYCSDNFKNKSMPTPNVLLDQFLNDLNPISVY